MAEMFDNFVIWSDHSSERLKAHVDVWRTFKNDKKNCQVYIHLYDLEVTISSAYNFIHSLTGSWFIHLFCFSLPLKLTASDCNQSYSWLKLLFNTQTHFGHRIWPISTHFGWTVHHEQRLLAENETDILLANCKI